MLPEKTRQEMAEASIRLAKAVNYDSVGTVEYLFDQDDGRFYFMEMNTRIQVEHPVTEQRTGIDLIAEQIKVAMGHKLTIKQKDINFRGHVIEFRINAEDPKTGMPSPGLITHYHRPGGLGVRSDDFIYTGYTVPPYYDSMVSKIIITADSREKCLARGMRALNEVVVSGIQTNIELHKRIITHPDFISSSFSTNFLTKIQE